MHIPDRSNQLHISASNPISDTLQGRRSPRPTSGLGGPARTIPKTIPRLIYDLRRQGGSSDGFYSDLASFSTRLLKAIDLQAGSTLDGYSLHVRERLCESPRSRGEYAIELLTLGMMLKLYADAAASTPGWVVELSVDLLWLRRRSEFLKKIADDLRAAMFRIFAVRKLWKATSKTSSFECLPHLIEWMHASGEFEQESMRLDNWKSYLGMLPRKEAEATMQLAADLFDWFKLEAADALAVYTEGVEPFLKTTYARRGLREDQLFCGRRAVEYHLGMVAADVMNRALQDEFERTPRKVVLLPMCMRGSRAENCRAHSSGVDVSCGACDLKCPVNRITRRMQELGVEVYLVPHVTGVSRWLERWQHQREVGVVAVACMLNIQPGGYEICQREILSQCVPLDFPGCRKHWSCARIPTAVNEKRLVQIVCGTGSR